MIESFERGLVWFDGETQKTCSLVDIGRRHGINMVPGLP